MTVGRPLRRRPLPAPWLLTAALLLLAVLPALSATAAPAADQGGGGHAYHRPAAATFDSHEVAVPRPDPRGEFRISATLDVPRAEVHGEGPHPAVFFVSGSGSQDRHGFQKTIDTGTWEILDAVAGAGFVVLRADDRGRGETPVGPPGVAATEVGFDDLVGDARAAVAYLRGHQAVDPERVFVVGHGEGGLTAQVLAGEGDLALAGLVTLSAMGRNLFDVTLDQIEAAADQAGLASEERERQFAMQRAVMEAVRSGGEPDFGVVDEGVWLRVQPMRTWWGQHFRLDVDAVQAGVDLPVLVAQGADDFQISVDEDARRIATRAIAAGSDDVTLRVYPGLDHLLKPTGAQPSTLQSYTTDRRVDPAFLADLVAWLERRAAR